MKNVKNLVLASCACLIITVVAGVMTAGPAVSQGARPVTDVMVVNGADQSVPVRVTSLPAVQVGNSSDAAVPVNVQNLPAVQTPPTPITLSGVVSVASGERFAGTEVFTVPGDKMLVIESLNYNSFSPDHTQRNKVTVETLHSGQTRFQRFVTEESLDVDGVGRTQVGAHNVQIFADPGAFVRVHVERSKATIGTSLHVTLTGYLTPAP